MHRFTSTLLLLYSATVFVPPVGRCDDSEAPLTVEDVVANWRQAVASIESVDAQFTRFVADCFAETMAVSKGRIAIDHGRRVAISFEPYDGPVGELPMARNGKPFGRSRAQNERWIFDHRMVMSVDDDKREAQCLERPQPSEPISVSKTETGLFAWEDIGKSILVASATLAEFIGPYDFSLEQPLPIEEELTERFDVQMINQTESNVRLRLRPLRQFDERWCQRIDIIVSRESWLPEAVRFLDPPGTKTTSFVITKRRINECSEQMDDAFRVNFEQYRCHTIPRSVPTVSSSRGDGKP